MAALELLEEPHVRVYGNQRAKPHLARAHPGVYLRRMWIGKLSPQHCLGPTRQCPGCLQAGNMHITRAVRLFRVWGSMSTDLCPCRPTINKERRDNNKWKQHIEEFPVAESAYSPGKVHQGLGNDYSNEAVTSAVGKQRAKTQPHPKPCNSQWELSFSTSCGCCDSRLWIFESICLYRT